MGHDPANGSVAHLVERAIRDAANTKDTLENMLRFQQMGLMNAGPSVSYPAALPPPPPTFDPYAPRYERPLPSRDRTDLRYLDGRFVEERDFAGSWMPDSRGRSSSRDPSCSYGSSGGDRRYAKERSRSRSPPRRPTRSYDLDPYTDRRSGRAPRGSPPPVGHFKGELNRKEAAKFNQTKGLSFNQPKGLSFGPPKPKSSGPHGDDDFQSGKQKSRSKNKSKVFNKTKNAEDKTTCASQAIAQTESGTATVPDVAAQEARQTAVSTPVVPDAIVVPEDLMETQLRAMAASLPDPDPDVPSVLIHHHVDDSLYACSVAGSVIGVEEMRQYEDETTGFIQTKTPP